MTERQKIAYREAALYHQDFMDRFEVDRLDAEFVYDRLLRHEQRQFADVDDFAEEMNAELALLTENYKRR
jgi:hypothetical protein